jgi:hypothetical protein
MFLYKFQEFKIFLLHWKGESGSGFVGWKGCGLVLGEKGVLSIGPWYSGLIPCLGLPFFIGVGGPLNFYPDSVSLPVMRIGGQYLKLRTTYFFLKLFTYLFIVVLGVHCGIYKSSYNIS